MTNKNDSLNTINQEEKTTPYSWFVAILVMLTFAMSFVSRYAWSTALPLAYKSLGISMAAAGGLMTAYYIGYVVSNFISGFIIDKFGPRITLGMATILTGIFTLAIGFTKGYVILFILRMLAGAASGPVFASMAKYQQSYFSKATRATAIGIMMSGPAIGTALSSAALAPVMKSSGWQAGFIYGAVACIIVGVIFYVFAKEKGLAAFRGSKIKTEEEKKLEAAGVKKTILQKSFVIGIIVNFLFLGGAVGYNTYMITYLTKSRGFDIVLASAIIGVANLLGIFGGVIAGGLSDILKNKKAVCIIGSLITGLLTISLLFIQSTTLLWIILTFRVITLAWVSVPLTALLSANCFGPYSGRAMGTANAVGQSASIVFPLLFGWILDLSGMNFTYMMIIITITLILCAIFVYFMTEKKPEEINI